MRSNDFNKIYKELLNILKDSNLITTRGLLTREIINYRFELQDPYNCLLDDQDKQYYEYSIKELFMFLKGSIDIWDMQKLSSFWSKIKNDDDTINSNYGHHIFHVKNKDKVSQFEFCRHQLYIDKNTRKAVIPLNNIFSNYKSCKDQICTMYLQFLIRDNKLDMYCSMRSNDAIYGLKYDVVFFCFIHILMYLMLKDVFDISLGSYHHHATSMHIYEKHFSYLK